MVDAVSRPTRPYVEMSFGMGINGYPAISMTQHAANKYAEWLSAKTGAVLSPADRGGVGIRLPCRDDDGLFVRRRCVAARRICLVFGQQRRDSISKVATKKPNPWGLFDMHGNVMEWTLDQYCRISIRRRGRRPTNPWVKATEPYPHAVRGGSWNDDADELALRARGRPRTHPGSSRTRRFRKASGITPTRSGWASGWCGRRRCPVRRKCTTTGTAAWSRSSAFLVLLPALVLAGPLQRFEAVEPHMGTLFRITLYAADQDAARRAFAAAYRRVSELEGILSDYSPASELNRVCRTAAERPVPVSPDLFAVLSAAQRLARRTNGAFDVTLGPVIRLWRQARRDGRLPVAAELAEAKSRSGYRKLVLDPAAGVVWLTQSGMQIDLGGIAKGYAADQVLRILRNLGIPRALVAASGDLAIGQAPPGKAGWRVGIGPLDKAGQYFARVLVLEHAAVSTSGDSQQFVELNGTRYSHIVNPKTGVGLTGSIGVTVVAEKGMDSDSLATAVSVLGLQRGVRLIEEQPGVGAVIVRHTTVGVQVVLSRRLRESSLRARAEGVSASSTQD